MLDYIYLMIIIALLLVVVFLIYLSYEYRIFNNLEGFTQQNTGPANLIDSYQTNLNNIVNKYNKIITTTYNNKINNDNIAIMNLLKNSNINKYKSGILNNIVISNQKKQETFPIDKVIKTIKSNYNSQYLSLVSNDTTKYGILLNDKCLSVSGTCPNGNGICAQECQKGIYVSDSQKFNTNRINNVFDAASMLGTTTNNINPKNIYPFNIFKSNVNDKCLTITDEGITLADCNLNSINQQWAISPNENICVLS